MRYMRRQVIIFMAIRLQLGWTLRSGFIATHGIIQRTMDIVLYLAMILGSTLRFSDN